MLKKVLIPFTAVLMLFGLFSCRMVPEDADFNDFLKTDLLGHFIETTTYTNYSSTEWNNGNYLGTRRIDTFGADGEYTRTIMIYEDYSQDIDGDAVYNEGYLPFEEYTGTYIYSPVLLTLEISYESMESYYNSSYNSYLDENEYTYFDTSETYAYTNHAKVKRSCYFTEGGFYSAYKANLGKWTYTYEEKTDDDYYKYESDISYMLDTLTFKARTYDSYVEMPLIFNLSWEREMSVTLDEPIITFIAGDTLELEGDIESERERDFWYGDYFQEWDDDPYDRVGDSFSTSLTNFGDFIAY